MQQRKTLVRTVFSRQVIGPILLVLTHLVLVAFFLPRFNGAPELLRWVLFGGFLSQVFLILLWATVGPGLWVVRVSLAALAAVAAGYVARAVTGGVEAFGYHTVTSFMLWTLVAEPSTHWGFRLGLAKEPVAEEPSAKDKERPADPVRFRTIHVLAALTFVAVGLAVFRVIDLQALWFMVGLYAFSFAGGSLMRASWFAMRDRINLKQLGGRLPMEVVLWVAPLAMIWSLAKPWDEAAGQIAQVMATAYAATLVTLLSAFVLRWSGYRWVSV